MPTFGAVQMASEFLEMSVLSTVAFQRLVFDLGVAVKNGSGLSKIHVQSGSRHLVSPPGEKDRIERQSIN